MEQNTPSLSEIFLHGFLNITRLQKPTVFRFVSVSYGNVAAFMASIVPHEPHRSFECQPSKNFAPFLNRSSNASNNHFICVVCPILDSVEFTGVATKPQE